MCLSEFNICQIYCQNYIPQQSYLGWENIDQFPLEITSPPRSSYLGMQIILVLI